MSKPKVIVFDIDGVLADFTFGFTTLGHKYYGIPIRHVDEQETWTWDEFPKDQESELWKRIAETKGDFWCQLSPIVSCSLASRIAWLTVGNNVYFLSSRPATIGVKLATEEWLRKNIQIRNPTVILVASGKLKSQVLQGLAADLFIDDYPPTVESVLENSKKTAVYLHPWKYNTYATHLPRLSLPEFLSLTEEIKLSAS